MFKGKKNIYVCDKCHGHIVTVDKDEGVTPFMTQCKATAECVGMMQSSMYQVFDQTIAPTHEWYKPQTVLGLSEHAKEHVKRGGLLLRRIGN